MGEIISLVPAMVSAETVSALEDLLERARAGQIVGIAWVCLRSGAGRYEGDIAGEARSALTFTRGALLALNEELGTMVRGKTP